MPQIAQDDEGFEIRSLADSLDDEDDEEEGRKRVDGMAAPNTIAESESSVVSRPKAVSQVAPPRPRESLDGETIFAVGEDGDRWSEDEESPKSSGERKRLTGSGS